MTMIWTEAGCFHRIPYETEAQFEEAVVERQAELFGENRIYLDVKRKIGVKGGQRNIPDGYLIDLASSTPQLFVVENELASHDPFRHIAVQILQFSISFEEAPRKVKTILFEEIQKHPTIKDQCITFARENGYRNLDHLLDFLVHDVPFIALVIIDEIPDRLENALVQKFRFGVEVMEFSRYRDAEGNIAYAFTPFMADLTNDLDAVTKRTEQKASVQAFDTIVVPARQEGFEEVFLGENCWYAIRIGASIRSQIKHIAAYQTAPVSAITHVATIASIEPWKDTGKFVVKFEGPAKEITPIPLDENSSKAPQSPRYTTHSELLKADTMDDLW